MSGQPRFILTYILLAAAAGVLGGILAYFWAPKIRARSAIQHFAAGLVIAAVASELIPQVESMGTPIGILGGFAAGGLAMIGLKWVVLKFENRRRSAKRLPVGLAAAAAVDTMVDGAIITAGFVTGKRLGVLLAIALGVEHFFLCLSVGSEFHKTKSLRWQGLAATSGIATMLLLGALGAFLFLRGAAESTVAIFLAFGAAALIYLIAEELLVENIQAEDSLYSTASLFAGFAALLAMKLFSHSARP